MNITISIMILSIIAVICILIALYFVIKSIKSKNLEPKIIELITVAEAKFASGEGNKKFEYVFDELYNKFAPSIIRILFSAEEIRNMIQFVFDKIKIALDYKGE